MANSSQQHKHTNRLSNETSPYLLQHAHNPVDWYPWGDEALTRAREEDMPILLSVGYSACHWCHVMERESFENEEIAAIMNKHFIAIKVDREERPDIDNIYMQAVQAITQQGGWPMTVFLMPDGRPFFGGTYYPPDDRYYGNQMMPGFRRILLSIAQAFKHQRAEIEEQARNLTDFLRDRSSAPLRNTTTRLSPALDSISKAASELITDFDATNGGFRGAPKFPNTMSHELLLRAHLHLTNGDLASIPGKYKPLHIVEHSLQAMARGGIYDQLGGGFHRYSVDDHWLAPHFEKMLYDNALLSRLYLHTYLITRKPFYLRVVEETLDYIVREMTSSNGGFYSTQDADSEGEEGKFFTWTADEIKAALPPDDATLFMHVYDVSEEGNFEGKNILHVAQDLQPLADTSIISLDELNQTLQHDRDILFKLREQRIKPGRDEKILTSWNGLMLRSFAEAARHLNRPDYLQVAINNATFLLNAMRPDGRLLRTYKDGRAHIAAYLEDHVFLADGLLALYEASFDARWFNEARDLMDQAIALFADQENGGFFDTGSDQEALISRPKDIMDNAIPSGNSVATDVLLRLAAFTAEDSYRQLADSYLNALVNVMQQHPQAFGHALTALDFALSSSKEIAILGQPNAPDTQALLSLINTRYLPNTALACASPDDTAAIISIPLLADRPLKAGKATAYICQHFTCQAPVNSGEELEKLL